MRFLLDEAIQHRLADQLAEAGHDATHVVRIGLAGAWRDGTTTPVDWDDEPDTVDGPTACSPRT